MANSKLLLKFATVVGKVTNVAKKGGGLAELGTGGVRGDRKVNGAKMTEELTEKVEVSGKSGGKGMGWKEDEGVVIGEDPSKEGECDRVCQKTCLRHPGAVGSHQSGDLQRFELSL